ELGLALGQPLARRRSLALRTVPIATGVVADLRVTALLVLAACDMAAELCRAAVLDRRHHLELLEVSGTVVFGLLEFVAAIIISGFLYSPGPRLADSLGAVLRRIFGQRSEEMLKLAGST